MKVQTIITMDTNSSMAVKHLFRILEPSDPPKHFLAVDHNKWYAPNLFSQELLNCAFSAAKFIHDGVEVHKSFRAKVRRLSVDEQIFFYKALNVRILQNTYLRKHLHPNETCVDYAKSSLQCIEWAIGRHNITGDWMNYSSVANTLLLHPEQVNDLIRACPSKFNHQSVVRQYIVLSDMIEYITDSNLKKFGFDSVRLMQILKRKMDWYNNISKSVDRLQVIYVPDNLHSSFEQTLTMNVLKKGESNVESILKFYREHTKPVKEKQTA